MFQPALPPRDLVSHKGSFGSIAIIGGSAGMVGAALLAARAALQTGAGRVYAALLSNDALSVDLCFPEIMLRSPDALIKLPQLNVVVIGPGLGQEDVAIDLLTFWLKQEVSMLLDADALNLIASHAHLREIMQKRHADTVITPHPGEASRLLNTRASHIQNHRIESALELAHSLHVICVLKGVGSVCAHYDSNYFINTTGNPALASGGTGDVLSGVIGSLMTQGLSGLEAAKLGVFVHGAAADALVARGIGPVGLTASEVAHEVRNVINQLNAHS
ncbi:bifunctional NAD(P)H-hydrate repair enzyme Nnr [mine drainage metagenome]|uniref:Bifunctional NAD(P)H-hydrate repair enzyme Nnr n=1 Tax=mine drainage metagenome TaxID=410659 RepID=A0A1J5TFP8_9ZZZZ